MNLNLFPLILLAAFVYSCEKGCTEPEATNYNSAAKKDDGTCYYEGCTDSIALNYWSLADTDDGSCEYESSLLVGKYLVEDSIEGGILPFEYDHRQYEIVIEQHPNFPESIVVTNFARIFSISAEQQTIGDVEGSSFTMSEQNPMSADPNLEDYTLLSGSGVLTGEDLVFEFQFLNAFGEAFSGAGTARRLQSVE